MFAKPNHFFFIGCFLYLYCAVHTWVFLFILFLFKVLCYRIFITFIPLLQCISRSWEIFEYNISKWTWFLYYYSTQSNAFASAHTLTNTFSSSFLHTTCMYTYAVTFPSYFKLLPAYRFRIQTQFRFSIMKVVLQWRRHLSPKW